MSNYGGPVQDRQKVYQRSRDKSKNYKPLALIVGIVCAIALGVGIYITIKAFDGSDNENQPENPAVSSVDDLTPDSSLESPDTQPEPPSLPVKPDTQQPPKKPDPDEDRIEYIIIDNPKIVITTRYNPSNREFNAQDAHARSVELAGGTAVQATDDRMLADMLRTGDTSNADAIAALYDGLILTGGGDISARFFGQTRHPASAAPDETRDIAEIELCRAFINAGKPVLGINRGMQVLNVTLGGDLIQDIPDLMDIDSGVHSGNNIHVIDINRDSWLYDLFGSSLRVSSSHHQAVGVLAAGFTVAAQHGLVIEAIEYGNLLGIQFNPERLDASASGQIFNDFIQRCSIYYIPPYIE